MGRVREMPMDAQTFRIGLQPRPQGRPLSDQGLVRDLDAVLTGDEQTGICQGRQDLPNRNCIV